MKLLTTGRQGVSFLVWPPIDLLLLAKAEDSSKLCENHQPGSSDHHPEKAVSRIEITAQPANLSYTSGQTLDLRRFVGTGVLQR